MKTALYPRLAWDGLRKNKRLFTPYLLTCVFMVMMFYILSFLGIWEQSCGTGSSVVVC